MCVGSPAFQGQRSCGEQFELLNRIPMGPSHSECRLNEFVSIDPAIRAWAERNHLPLFTHYQEAEVRSFALSGPSGRAQIWVEAHNSVIVHVWDYGKRRESFPSAASAALEEALDSALLVGRCWCGIP